MAKQPHIGITTSYKDGRQAVDHYYISAVEKAGGLPIIVPMLATQEAAKAFASLLDGLIITGGPGITKGLIGTLPEDLEPVDPVRDLSDTYIYDAMSDKPVFGICYGMQFINAQAGGTIYADLNVQHVGAGPHSNGRGAKPHPVTLVAGSRLADILGQTSVMVNTYHIQAISETGTGLDVTAYGDDGIIEGIASSDGRQIGVQWHPERLPEQLPLFEAFVEQCRQTLLTKV